jgi:hypothetical protein
MNKYLVCCEVKRQEIVAVEAANTEEAIEEAKFRLDEFDEIVIEHVSVPMGNRWVCVDD